MSALRAVLALAVAVAIVCAVLGVGMGEAPAERMPPPSTAATAAAKQRIAAGGATVRRGRELFSNEGCDRCHAIAAIGAGGALGPRLDTLTEESEDVRESIEEPRDHITDGFPEQLMPADYADRLSDADLDALAAFVAASSGLRDEDGGGGGRGRGRGRGGSGED